MGFKKCAIISSYTPNKGELRTDTVSDEDDTENFLKYETYLKMLGLDPSDLQMRDRFKPRWRNLKRKQSANS